MKLDDVVRARRPALPWTEGRCIPWNDPEFSRRMLQEHLSQDHNAASRRMEIIRQQVEWIDAALLNDRSSALVLDLGCGPGLYTNALARRGHHCHGVDFSPASVEYARATAESERLNAVHVLSDLRRVTLGQDYDLVMLIFGELNVFPQDEAEQILTRCHRALRPGGKLLLEVSTEEHLRQLGQGPSTWYASSGGLFSERPHLVLKESYWDEPTRSTTIRYSVVDAQSSEVTPWAESHQAYSREELAAKLTAAGFRTVHFHSRMGGAPAERGMIVIVAEA